MPDQNHLITQAQARLDALFCDGWRIGDLVAFHSREKLLLLAHHRPTYESLGRLVANAKQQPRDEVTSHYTAAFMLALNRPVKRGSHKDVLQHMAGYFKNHLSNDERRHIKAVIDEYFQGCVPLNEPLELVRKHAETYNVTYLLQQTYFDYGDSQQ